MIKEILKRIPAKRRKDATVVLQACTEGVCQGIMVVDVRDGGRFIAVYDSPENEIVMMKEVEH